MFPRRVHPALSHAVYRGVELTPDDAEAGVALSTEAGWNQNTADWRLLLGAGTGLGFEDATGSLVASAVIFPYGGKFAWIGMVLVSASARRQKLATLLMSRLLALAAERAWLPLLDATADGRTVYVPLGFRDLRTITRWYRPVEATSVIPAATAGFDISVLGTVAEWHAWDAQRFGADRSALLADLRSRQPALALQARWTDGRPAGYCLAREGRIATEIGPVVAETSASAAALLDAAIVRASGALLIDLVDGDPLLDARLRAHGFLARRNFVRMIFGHAAEPGLPAAIRAITGPEFG